MAGGEGKGGERRLEITPAQNETCRLQPASQRRENYPSISLITDKSKYSEPMACLSTSSKQEILPQGNLTALSCCHPLQAAVVGTSPPRSAAMPIIQKGENQENVYHHWARHWFVPQFPSAQVGKHSESCLGAIESSRVSSGKFCRNKLFWTGNGALGRRGKVFRMLYSGLLKSSKLPVNFDALLPHHSPARRGKSLRTDLCTSQVYL